MTMKTRIRNIKNRQQFGRLYPIHLHTADLTELEEFLRQLAGQSQDEFVPFILDVQDFDHPESIDLGGMISLFARYGMQI